MKDQNKTKAKLIIELAQLRQRVAELEASEIEAGGAEAALRETSELLEKIFSTTHLLIAYMDTEFNFIRVNHAYAAADGRQPEFFVGKNHFDLYPHEDNRSIFRRVVQTGEPYTAYAKPFEYAEHPERGVTYWDWTLHPVKDASGEVEGLVLGLLNVTERVKVEAELRKHRDHLEVLVEERTHELRAANEELQREIEERKGVEGQLKWQLAVTSALSELYKPLISARASIEDIANVILKQAKKLTGSMHGYVSSIDPNTGDTIAHTLTQMLKGQCAVSEENQRIVFPRGEDGLYPGLWGHALNTLQAFFSNSPETHEASAGIPEGHVPIRRFLSVPVIFGQELVGQIALANKSEDYTEWDLEAIRRMAEFYALAIQRNRAEEALRESEEKYRSMMEAMTDPVYICSADFRVAYMNPAMRQRIGRDATGEPCYKVIYELDEKCPWCVHERVQKGEHVKTEIVSPKDRRSYHISHSPIFHVDGSISKMTIFRDITEQKQAEEELRKARDSLEQRVKERTAELQSLSYRLLDVQEDERKRIAGDLHDGIGQSLSAIKFSVESVLDRLSQEADPSTPDILRSLIPMLQDAIEEVRKTVMNLRPSILDDLGIVATISWFFRQFQAVYSGIRVEEQIQVQETEVPEAFKTNIFRVLQEAANNVAKHSQADRVLVALRKRDEAIELVVEDNGCGFDLRTVPHVGGAQTGFGITSMKERTELSGGSFSIESKNGVGTTIRASWPYKGASRPT